MPKVAPDKDALDSLINLGISAKAVAIRVARSRRVTPDGIRYSQRTVDHLVRLGVSDAALAEKAVIAVARRFQMFLVRNWRKYVTVQRLVEMDFTVGEALVVYNAMWSQLVNTLRIKRNRPSKRRRVDDDDDEVLSEDEPINHRCTEDYWLGRGPDDARSDGMKSR